MKRSEMLELIRNWLYSNEEIIVEPNFDNVANELLDFLEKEGMMPPTITIMKESYNRTEGTYGFEVNEWEEE